MATADTDKEIVRRGFDALNDRDRDAFRELHANDAVVDAFGEQYHGIEAIEDEEFGLFDAFSDMTYTVDALVADGAIVAARWTATGTHDGEFAGIEPTHESVEFPVFGMFRVDGERITAAWILPDRLAMMEQLGMVERPLE